MSKGETWTAADLLRLKDAVAAGNTARDIEAIFDRSRKSIITAVKRHDLGPWVAKPGSKPGDTTHIPEDFADRWQTNSLMELAAYYGRSTSTVSLWTKRLGLARKRGAHIGETALPCPANLREAQAGLTVQQLSARYNVGKDVIRRWLSELGIKRDRFQQPLRIVKPNAFATAPIDRPHRDASRAGMAASYMQRQGWIVYRCDEMGRQQADGLKWRCGTVTISDDDLIARAVRKGWDADAWKRVA